MTWPDHAGEELSRYFDWQIFAWPSDTTTAMLRVAMSGVFHRYTRLKIVAHRCGALVPLYAARIDAVFKIQAKHGGIGAALAEPSIDNLRNFYCNTATFGIDPAMLSRGAEFFRTDRLLFGTDSPMKPTEGLFSRNAAAGLDALEVSLPVRTDIFAGNASRLLRI